MILFLLKAIYLEEKNYFPSLKKNLKYTVETQRLHYLSTNVQLIIEMCTGFVNQAKSILKN